MMNRNNGTKSLAHITKFLATNHRPAKAVEVKPPPKRLTSYPSSTRSNAQTRQERKARVDEWETATDPIEKRFTRSYSSLQRSVEARVRLFNKNQERAQSVRDELSRYKDERHSRHAEEQALFTVQSRARMDAWDTERQQREAEAARLKRTREASEIVRKAEFLMMARVNKKTELERLRSLKERMIEMEAKRYELPNRVKLFSAIPVPGKTMTETLLKLNRQRQLEYDASKKKRQATIESHVTRQRRHHSLPGPSAPSRREPPKRKRVASTQEIHAMVHDSRAQELARLKRELHLLEIQHPTKTRSKK